MLGAVSLALMAVGELGALVSHFKPSFILGIVVGCYLFLFSGKCCYQYQKHKTYPKEQELPIVTHVFPCNEP